MAKKADRNLFVGLDIGTAKVQALVAKLNDNDELELVGVGSQPSRGLKKGVVVNIEATVQSIQKAVEEAELMAGCQIHSVYASVSGSHVRGINSHGVTAIRGKEVNHEDVARAIDAARAVKLPADQKILHVIPQEFIIDDQDGIREPIGMAGVRLEVRAHLVSGGVSAQQNVINCVHRCGLEVDEVVLEAVADSYAILSPDEQELGICLLDVGAGTSDIAIYAEGALRHTAVIPIAGDQITNDLAVALRIPVAKAEETKRASAPALRGLADSEEMVTVPTVGQRPPREVRRQKLAEVVEARYEELFDLVQKELRLSGLDEHLAAGIVLTGGSAQMPGVIELAEQVFGLPVRLGLPKSIIGAREIVEDAHNTTGIGLLHYGRLVRTSDRVEFSLDRGERSPWRRMADWLRGNL